MKISACVIVKNEEKNLPAWLDCVKRIADELLVVDTGSTDKTVELAKAAGARIEYFSWIHDFSAARNFTIEQAKGDWILFLDADEYFLADDCSSVKKGIERYHRNPEIAGLIFPRRNIDRATGRQQGGVDRMLRAFRNLECLRYEGRIHEALHNLSNQGMTLKSLPGPFIYHTGYSSDVIRDKTRRNLELLQQGTEKRGIDDFYLMDCCFATGDYEKAIAYAQKFIESGARAVGAENRVYMVRIYAMMKAKRSPDEIYRAVDEAIRHYPDLPEFYMLWGMQDWLCQDYLMAEKHYRQSMELFQKEGETLRNTMLASHSHDFLPVVYLHLGIFADWQGYKQEALEFYVEHLKIAPKNWMALQKLCRMLRNFPATDVIPLFDSIYDRQKDGAFLAENFSKMGMGEVALYYERCSGQQVFDAFERHLLADDLLGATTELANSMKKA